MFTRTWLRIAWVLTVLLGVLPPMGVHAAAPPDDGATPVVKLKAGTIAPGQEIATAAGLTIDGYAPDEAGLYIVQFVGPVQADWRAQLAALDVDILGYLPDYAFSVRMTPGQAAQIATWDFVNLVTIFQPAYKLDPDLHLDGPNFYVVQIAPDVDAAQATAAIAASVTTVLQQQGTSVRVLADPGQLPALARIPAVTWIENFTSAERHNEYGGGLILGSIAANAAGYDGATQILAIADTGLGRGTAPGAHPDIPFDRIVNIQNFSGASASGCYTVIDNGARDLSSGHGTHVAVTAVGDSAPNGMARGVAPSARLLFQAIEDYVDFIGDCELAYTDGYYLFGIPDALGDLFQAAYDGGARLHSNSWGADVSGAYTANSAAADDFVYRHPEMTIIFSAGNRGADKNSDGFVDGNSIEAPATAKNVIAVGASENDRAGDYPCDAALTYPSNDPFQGGKTCAEMGGQNTLGTYGARWPDAFPVEPIFGDVTAGNRGQMAAFSGRGPTDDGRIKPDVVAPGTWLLSGYSELYRQGYDAEPNSVDGKFQLDGWGLPAGDRYKYFGGTSMATPLVAGAATVVRDRYQRDFDHAASAALVKATLINTAVDLPDENNDGVNDNDFPIPNIHEGWGRVDLVAATQVAAFVDEGLGVLTDGVRSYTYQLGPGAPFKVTLVWSDFPAAEAAAVSLVNDLDLEVTSPAGVTYAGNVFAGGWSQPGGEPDRVNNVENVFIPSAAAGVWTVTVRGVNVPAGNQPYALVVDGAVEDPVEEPVDEPPTVAITAPADNDQIEGTVNIAAAAADDNGIARVEFYIDGGLLGVDSSSPYAVNWNSTNAVNGRHKLRVQAIDTADQTAQAEITVLLDNPLPDEPPRVDIIAPAANTVVEEIVTIAVNAEDDVGIHTVEVLIDGQPFTRDDTPPYIVHWDSRDAANGLHEIRAKAVDTVGQWRDAGVIVEVDNPVVKPVLPLSIVEPADNATISGTVTISAQVAAPDDVSNVEFYVDGRSIGATTIQPYAVEWDSRGVANGTRLLTVLSFSPDNGFNNASVEVTVDNPPPAPSLLLSAAQGGDVGVRFSDEDILRYDPNTGVWSLFFDGSDVGLGASFRHDVDAFDVMMDGAILLSLVDSGTLPDVGWVDDSDVVRFVPETLGQNTSGRFELYFDGSDVGLDHDGEDIDALQLLPDGDLVISTVGTVFAPGVTGKDEDLLRFTPTTLGANTAGRWSLYADGSDIGLGDERAEDTSALAVGDDGATLYVAMHTAFAAQGITGTGADILACTPGTLGPQTQCALSLFWRGNDAQFVGQTIDGLDFLPANSGILARIDDTASNDPLLDTFDDVEDEDLGDDFLGYLPLLVRQK